MRSAVFSYLLLGCAAPLIIVALLPSAPPTELTPRQKRDIVSRMHTEILVGQLLYDLPTVMPPPVAFDLTNGNAAESECTHVQLRDGHPDWLLRINERMAAQHWDAFMDETIPHEAGHLIACQLTPDWDAHNDRWATIVRELGAEPKEFHHFNEETP